MDSNGTLTLTTDIPPPPNQPWSDSLAAEYRRLATEYREKAEELDNKARLYYIMIFIVRLIVWSGMVISLWIIIFQRDFFFILIIVMAIFTVISEFLRIFKFFEKAVAFRNAATDYNLSSSYLSIGQRDRTIARPKDYLDNIKTVIRSTEDSIYRASLVARNVHLLKFAGV